MDLRHDVVEIAEIHAMSEEKVAELLRVFQTVDADGNGALEAAELREAFSLAGVEIAQHRLVELFDDLDIDGDGMVSFIEFCHVFETATSTELHALHSVITEAIAEQGVMPDSVHFVTANASAPQVKFLVGGCVAGFVSRTVVAPLERVLILKQLNTGTPKSIRHHILRIVRTEGVHALWRGNLLSCVRAIPFVGIVCFTYTYLTSNVFRLQPEITLGDEGGTQASALRLLSGAMAGMLAATATYPLEVVKTRLQAARRSSLRSVLGDLWRSGGFYGGLRPTLWTVAPFVAVDKMAYATMLDKLKENGISGNAAIIASGAVSGAIGQTAVHAVDIVRHRMQVGQSYTSTMQGLRSIWTTEGLRGLTRGLGTAYCKMAPAMATTYLTIDNTVRLVDYMFS
eukprot:Sspe_Gene.37498::Locus_18104_Transcript_1_1_Confidence_1.000_Length_5032::g.37498::m.37498/K14684/SLC25A23S; solute carrier family 25 (mitochondrial phosphate transporter), member 23/24/25/41